jgi:hypothetical protein
MLTKKAKSEKRWSMYPSLHDSVSRLLEEANLRYEFHGIDQHRELHRRIRQTLWVDPYVATVSVALMDGQVIKSLSLYECIMKPNTTQGYIINDAKAATASVDHPWIIRMWEESHIISKNGVGSKWILPITLEKAKARHTIVIYVEVAEMAIALRSESMGF